MGADVVCRTYRMGKRTAWSRFYDLTDGEGTVVASLRLASTARQATAAVGGEAWRLQVRGFFGTRVVATDERTQEVLADLRGRQAEILGRPGYRWERAGLWAGREVVDPEGRTVATFGRLRGAWRPWCHIETTSGDPRVDLVCAVLGSRLLLFRRQQNQPSGGGS